MSKDGYIKLHRKMVDWEWYDDLNTFKLFIHLLLKVNHKDNKWRGEVVKRGTCITSRASLSLETGLSEQQVRTALDKLISTKDITKITNKKNTLIIVTNYNIYQESNQEDNQQLNQVPTNEQPSSNQVVTTNKNDKKEKNDKKDNKKESKYSHGLYKHVLLTDEEFEILQLDFSFYQSLITKLDEYIETSGKKYKNHNLVLRGWVLDWYKENNSDEVVEDVQEVTEVQTVDNAELKGLLETLKKGEL